MSEITLGLNFYVQHCSNCGIAFAVPFQFDKSRRRDKVTFWCPNGHGMSYTQSEAERLREELQRAREAAQQELEWRLGTERILERERKVRHSLQKRLSAGVCPCCNRTFTDLQRHMGTKHKDYALPPAKETKLIEGTVQ